MIMQSLEVSGLHVDYNFNTYICVGMEAGVHMKLSQSSLFVKNCIHKIFLMPAFGLCLTISLCLTEAELTSEVRVIIGQD